MSTKTALCSSYRFYSLKKNVSRANALLFSGVAMCPMLGRSLPAAVACYLVRSGVFHYWIQHLRPQGAVPQGFNPLQRGWVYCPASEAPKKANADGARGIFGTACRVRLQPFDRTHTNILTLVGRRINTTHDNTDRTFDRNWLHLLPSQLGL